MKEDSSYPKAVFLDRDGIVNIDKGYVYRISELQLVPGIISFCLNAQNQGYKLIIITNQSGIARKMYTQKQMMHFHDHLTHLLKQSGVYIEDIFYCVHHPHFNGRCFCRKPGTLLLERAAATHQIDLSRSYIIGDSERDILAGKSMGCKTILVGYPNHSSADWVVDNLHQASLCLS